MTELETYIAANGEENVAAMLRADPSFAAFNMLWQAPWQLAVLCNFFGLSTIADAQAFAAGLMDGSTWVARRGELSQWLNPRPGVLLSEMRRVNWLTVEPVLTTQVPAGDPYWVQPNDGTVCVPTLDQLRTIMANCPAVRYPWRNNDNDCDDHTRILRGWLSQHGLGPCTIGFGGYRVFNAAGEDIGGHALGLAICANADGTYTPWLAEPRDGKVYPISTTTLGGYTSGTRIAFQRAIF